MYVLQAKTIQDAIEEVIIVKSFKKSGISNAQHDAEDEMFLEYFLIVEIFARNSQNTNFLISVQTGFSYFHYFFCDLNFVSFIKRFCFIFFYLGFYLKSQCVYHIQRDIAFNAVFEQESLVYIYFYICRSRCACLKGQFIHGSTKIQCFNCKKMDNPWV